MSRFMLSADLSRSIAILESDLRAELQQLQDALEGRSEQWRDSDAGTAVAAWIELLSNLADDLEAVTDEPQ